MTLKPIQIFLLAAVICCGCKKKSGVVIEAESRHPVPHAVVSHNGRTVVCDDAGKFVITHFDETLPIMAKASGYRAVTTNCQIGGEFHIALAPFRAQGLYLAYGGLGFKKLRESVLKTVADTGMNTIVMDIKGDRGLLSFPVDVPLAGMSGALASPTVDSISDFIHELHKRNLYLAGRIVVFRDPVLAKFRPEWTVENTKTGKPWVDGSGLPWLDPFHKEVVRYNIDLAVAAAKLGFDEIQFDFLRFPTTEANVDASYRRKNSFEHRVEVINSFLDMAAEQLAPYNVYTSVSLSGFAPWVRNSGYGPLIEDEARRVDYVCPAVFPSNFKTGDIKELPENPTHVPQKVVSLALAKAKDRLPEQALKVRPFLQAFEDKEGGLSKEYLKQTIENSEAEKVAGWILWDPANKYTNVVESLSNLAPAVSGTNGPAK